MMGEMAMEKKKKKKSFIRRLEGNRSFIPLLTNVPSTL